MNGEIVYQLVKVVLYGLIVILSAFLDQTVQFVSFIYSDLTHTYRSDYKRSPSAA